MSPTNALETLASHLQQRRLALGLTQAGLSARSGVALGTLRKFERTGLASTEALIKLLSVLGGLDAVIAAAKPEETAFTSIDEVLQAEPRAKRKYGWRT